MANNDTRPIGIFDSGVGGLSVLREIRALLPEESLIYCADSGHAPYGDKSQQVIRERSLELAEFLVSHEVKAIVIACNTATAAASRALRERWPSLPVIGMEPAVKPATAATRSGTVGVLATVGTLSSAQFAALLDTFGQDVRVVTQPGVGLVEAVERGELDSDSTRHMLSAHLQPLLAAGADVIVLGCTHYVFLRPLVETIVGPGVKVIDTGAAVARQLERRLVEGGHRVAAGAVARPVRFWCSGNPGTVAHAIDVLWGEHIWPDALPRSQTIKPHTH
ncbi:glutamate racemase [Niveibacterium umoris]|uniref:Glutamate racemase n=1 Tax=Niveibacterium umoris TaxID=1193620 RepID=A0A840BQL2_9RHOO|nr:glutamate racemase [Niveibacterium umoris]